MAEKGVKSARGEMVDFDLMKIKAQIATAPKPVTVKTREDFIDQKFKRRLARQVREVTAEVNTEPTGEVEEPVVEVVNDKNIQEGLKALEPKDKKDK